MDFYTTGFPGFRRNRKGITLHEIIKLLLCFFTVFYTNIGMGAKIDIALQDAGLEKWKESRKLASIAHGRRADELTWRAAKEFGSEKLPFKNFYSNAGYFYFMVISFPSIFGQNGKITLAISRIAQF